MGQTRPKNQDREALGPPSPDRGFANTAEPVIEQKLREALDFQKLVFSSLEDFIFVKDSEFRIVQANPKFLSLYPPEVRDGVIGTTTFESYRPEEREVFVAEDRRALESGHSEIQENIDFPDGRRRALWTKKIGFDDEEGNRFVLGVSRDITALKETEAALRESNAELEEFAYRVSHDLRAPLVSSRQLLKMIQEALDSDDRTSADTFLEAASTSLEKLDRLAHDILDVSRVRLRERKSEPVDLPAIVTEVWERLTSHTADAPSLHTQFDLEEGICSDRDALSLILDNLISNAFKYRNPAEPEPQVSVDLTSFENTLLIAVADNGLGIPPESRSRVGEMFQRFHPGHSAGSGLGLYMVQKWAERLSGVLRIEHLEPGTRFIVQIPHTQSNC